MDDQQRARGQFEAWAAGVSYRGSNIDTTRNDLVPNWYLDPLAALAWRCWKAALRAAPGIDVDLLETAEDFISRHSYAWNGEGSHPNTIITGLRTLIDASPKGGSDAQAEIAMPPLPEPFGCLERSGMWNGERRYGFDDVYDADQMRDYAAAAVQAAMQATSAEVRS